MENFLPPKKFFATGVGSLPHIDARTACQFILNNFKENLIFWPQMVKRSFLENMYVQFSQGLPGVVIEKEKQRIYFDTGSEDFLNEMEKAFNASLESDIDYFAISEEYALGFYEMLKLIQDLKDIVCFKGQIIGPISFGLTLKDQNNQPVFYNKDLQEIITKTLAMKAKWQIKKVRSKNEKLKTIIFIDEPYLVSVGSSYINLKKDDVVSQINEVALAIHEEEALAGIHCCGNTDWGMVLETQIDILNFDAYNFLETILLYPQQLKSFLGRGGILAWGIAPTTDAANEKNIKNLLIDKILKIGLEKDMLQNQIIITPSCGCGTLSAELAEEILKLSVGIAEGLNNKKIL